MNAAKKRRNWHVDFTKSPKEGQQPLLSMDTSANALWATGPYILSKYVDFTFENLTIPKMCR